MLKLNEDAQESLKLAKIGNKLKKKKPRGVNNDRELSKIV